MNRWLRPIGLAAGLVAAMLPAANGALGQAGGSQSTPAAEQQSSSAPPTPAHPMRVFDAPGSEPDSAAGTTNRVAPGVEIVSGVAGAASTAPHERKSSYEIKVGTTKWVDTGIPLNAGDSLAETATGTLTFADGHTADADGARAGWRDLLRQYPLPAAPVGALIGRVGNSDAVVPFVLGAKGKATAEISGNLFLRANVSNDLGADGEYTVRVTFPAQAISVATVAGGLSAATTRQATDARLFRQEVTPALFANIPRRVADAAGGLGDMVNFALIGSEDQMKQAFAAAGWVPVDKTVEGAIVHGLEATMQHKAYLEVPMSTLYLFGRGQDLSYARAAPLEVAAVRHHLRVWNSGQTVNGRTLWVGSATHDNGFEKDQRNGEVTHHIDPNIDEERDFVLASFEQAGATSVAAYVLPANPVVSAKTATGGSFNTDGRIATMELK